MHRNAFGGRGLCPDLFGKLEHSEAPSCEAGRFVASGDWRWEAKLLWNREWEGGGGAEKEGTRRGREKGIRGEDGSNVRSRSTPLLLCNCILLLREEWFMR